MCRFAARSRVCNIGQFLLSSLVGEPSNPVNPSSSIPGVCPDNEDVLWRGGPSDFEGFNSLGAYSQCVITSSYMQFRLTDKCHQVSSMTSVHSRPVFTWQPCHQYRMTSIRCSLVVIDRWRGAYYSCSYHKRRCRHQRYVVMTYARTR